MARNGTDGTYNTVFTAVAGTTVLASDYNAQNVDIATALSQSLAKDGQTVPTNDLPMGTRKHTNVGAATARTHYARADQVQDGAFIWGGTAGGTGDAHTVTLSPSPSEYTTGMRLQYISPASPNATEAPTVDVSSLGVKTIKTIDSYPLAPGDIPPSSIVDIIYDGTNFRLARHLPPRANLIINGGMTIDQRNSGGAVTPAAVAVTLDRWLLSISVASKITVQQITAGLTGAASHAAKLLVAAGYTAGAGEAFAFQQNIEGISVAGLGWGAAGAFSLAVSFDFYSSATGTFAVSVTNSAGNRSYVKTFSYGTAATWQRVALVFPGDTTGTWLKTAGAIGISLRLDLGSGSNFETTVDTWAGGNYTRVSGAIAWVATTSREIRMTRVKAEIASPTAFTAETIGDALRRCLRFYQPGLVAQLLGTVTSGIVHRHVLTLLAVMSKVPTFTFSSETVTSFPSGNPSTTGSTAALAIFDKTANASGGGLFSYVVVADAEI